jgi:hypothetical protein
MRAAADADPVAVFQYFRLCRERRPGRATFDTSYCSYPASSSRSIALRYMAAATSSGACDQRARAISSLIGAFGYSSSRYSDMCSGARAMAWSTDSIHSVTPCSGSHIIRSRLTLSKPAARASPTRRRARRIVQPRQGAAVPRRGTIARRSSRG